MFRRKKKPTRIDYRKSLLINPMLHQEIKTRCKNGLRSMKEFVEYALEVELERTRMK